MTLYKDNFTANHIELDGESGKFCNALSLTT